MFRTFVRGREQRPTLIFLILIIVFTGADILIDLRDEVSIKHILHEIFIIVFALVIVVSQLKVLFSNFLELKRIQQELDRITLEQKDFLKKTINYAQGFSQAVREQFNKWGLTESEADVAALLIKGLSMKEIAELRHSKEATVRQQAVSVYKKSHLENRQQLSAFFLEDIFSI